MLQITCRYQIVMLSTLHKLILMSVRRVHEIRRTTIQQQQQYPRDGVVVRVSASQSVDLGFIPLLEPYEKTLKMVFVASLLGARDSWDVVENKPASSFVVPQTPRK